MKLLEKRKFNVYHFFLIVNFSEQKKDSTYKKAVFSIILLN